MLIWRYIRQRRVLVLIFGSSLLYFLIKTGLLSLPSIIKRRKSQDDLTYSESQLLRAPKSIDWRSSANSGNQTNLGSGQQRCRYTKQSKRWVVDELGFICDRYQLTPGGCCRTSLSSRFLCSSCDTRSTHCCSTYEHCVSCCLQPSQRALLETVLKLTNGSRLRALLMVKDQYELCVWKCRTSSNSVYQENKYKNPKTKYCYGPEPKLPFTR